MKRMQHRELDVALAQLVDELLQVDAAGRVLRRVDGDVAVVVDREVALAPVLDAVELGGVLERPVAVGRRWTRGGWRRCRWRPLKVDPGGGRFRRRPVRPPLLRTSSCVSCSVAFVPGAKEIETQIVSFLV